MKTRKFLLVFLSIGLLAIALVFFFKRVILNREIRSQKTAYIVDPERLHYNFTSYHDSSLAIYLHQIIQLQGKVVEFELEDNGASVVLIKPIAGITCLFDSITVANDYQRISTFEVGDSITLKGRCDGYDMIMGVILSDCVLQ